jgi:REP element-mobilizing transposase RayT
MNRGARRESLFHDDVARDAFLGYVAELPERFGLLIHAYALMPNHYHLLVESTQGRLSDGMAFVGSRYAQWVNLTHPDWDGPLFRGRFHSKEVISEEHWHHLPVYLHLNPLRARLVMRLNQTRWTSHKVYAGTAEAPDWLTTDDLLAGYGSARGYREYMQEVRKGRSGPPEGFNAVTFDAYARRQKADKSKEHRQSGTLQPRAILKLIAAECGVSQKNLKEVRRGREGNWPKKLAAFWLVMRAGLKNTEVATLLNMHPVRVSQAIRDVRSLRDKDSTIAEQYYSIEQKLLIARERRYGGSSICFFLPQPSRRPIGLLRHTALE